MAYSELVKNFNRIREYMREFYVYGFKSREEYTKKSARSYDNERRRLESWLGDYMQFRRTPDGKNMFLSIDSRSSGHNPLYKAWKAKSFTDGDITLHFLIFDILSSPDIRRTTAEITREIDQYLREFPEPKMFDESTIRKKLKEYAGEGILLAEKSGRTVFYRRPEATKLPDRDMLDYFSEVLPCGVIGSFLLDKNQMGETEKIKQEKKISHFAFKHHYITGTMDSEVLYELFAAIRKKQPVTLEMFGRNRSQKQEPIGTRECPVVPLKVMISAQSGRQYLMAYSFRGKRIIPVRTDRISSVKNWKPFEISGGNESGAQREEMEQSVAYDYDELQEKLRGMLPHMWGVSTQSVFGNRMEHVEFTIRYQDDEQHIRRRLEREKRCGRVEHMDANTSRFSIDVYDSSELIPWIRTFICRITEIHFSNAELEAQFKKDIRDMYEMYGLGGEEE